MKIGIIFDPTGNIVGTALARYPGSEEDAETEEVGIGIEVGFVPTPGQTVHEVEVQDELTQLEGADFLRKLREVDAVKQTLLTLPTAGQGDMQSLRSAADAPDQLIATAGQGEPRLY